MPPFPSRLALVILAATACAGTGRTVEDDAPRPEVVPLSPLVSQLAPRSLGAALEAPSAPVNLTASDGTGLRLVSMRARAVVSEPLAFTELHLVFDNPQDRILEGHFTIDLPPGSAISRLAMKIDEHWQEGEVVERQAARVAYESFLHRKQDPALLENQAGNRFGARVFPIPARGRKEIVISYSQALPDSRVPYELALAGLPELDRLDVDVRIERPGGGDAPSERVEIHERAHTPMRNLEVRSAMADAPVGLRHGDHVLARIEVDGAVAPDPIDDLTILFDTSASRALGFDRQLRRLEALVARLREEGDFPLRVVAFDQEVVLAFDGSASGFGQTALDAIYSRGAFGASDLQGALHETARAGRTSRVLLMTDGIATAGEAEVVALTSAARGLADAGVGRLDAIIDGGLQDREVLGAITTAGLPRAGIVIDARVSRDEIAAKLRRTALEDLEVSVPGASFVWPQTLRGLQPGDEALVYAELPPESAMRVVLEGHDDVRSGLIALTPAPGPLLARALAGARIDALTLQRSALAAEDAASRARLQAEIVALSTRHRVVSDFTALLVLETEDDYARFAIDRRALAEIVTVGERGIEVLDRAAIAPAREGVPREGVPREPETAVRTAGFEAPGAPAAPRAPATRPEPAIPPEPVVVPDPAALAERPAYPAGRVSYVGTAFAIGNDDEDVWGGLVGTPIGEAHGAGGLGLVGDGRGGGGAGEEMEGLGVGGLGLVGNGRGGGGTGEEGIGLGLGLGMRGTGGRGGGGPRALPVASNPYEGRMLEIMTLLERGGAEAALEAAARWHDESPGDVLALVAMGEALEALERFPTAARVYGSLIDLFPSRADMRRYAGNRLERIPALGRRLAVDTYRQAVAQRPDHPNGHRLYAWALVRDGRLDEGFAAILAGIDCAYPTGRFLGVDRILHVDAGLIGAALVAQSPASADAVTKRLAKHNVGLADRPSTRFVMTWETDANDVDLHIHDGKGAHALYSSPQLESGGTLFADVTNGYGPECFAIEGTPSAFPYRLEANYYARGPMGFGMGTLQIVEHDGKGGLRFEDRPFLIMKDQAMIALGEFAAPIGVTQGE